jgi:REP element-mobilizing transposase RayT
MSRSAGGQFIFKKVEKAVFVHQMRKVARFCGIKFLSFSVMGNHYHQVIKVPARIRLSDGQLLKRVRDYYGAGSPEYKRLERALSGNGMDARLGRLKFIRMMGNVSVFQKLLKQRFSIWFNHRHDRRGTLWMERFKSTLVENTLYVRMCVSAYVDLNAVRAGIVADPKEYPFCSYAMALSGDPLARSGICAIAGTNKWEKASAAYRVFMMKQGSKSVSGKNRVSRDLLLKTLEEGGKLPVADLLRLSLRFFSDGLAIGSESFLKKAITEIRTGLSPDSVDDLDGLPGGDWHSMKALQRFRKPVIS